MRCSFGMIAFSVTFFLLAQTFLLGEEPLLLKDPTFRIKVVRKSVKMVYDTINKVTKEWPMICGTLYVDGKKIGSTLERKDRSIDADVYKGAIRTRSEKALCLDYTGLLRTKGDFLVEVLKARRTVNGKEIKMTNVLFHTGIKPSHVNGCILVDTVTRLGPLMDKNKAGEYKIPGKLTSDSPLVKMRKLFYGEHAAMDNSTTLSTTNPTALYSRDISIEIVGLPKEKEQK